MKIKLKILCTIFIIVSVVSACQRSEDVAPQEFPVLPVSSSIKGELGNRFGIGLSRTLKFPEVRTMLKREILKQFDGDYNVLFQQVVNERVTVNEGQRKIKSFGELISESLVSERNPNTVSIQAASFLDSLERLLPLLQIRLSELEEIAPDSWDAESTELPIALAHHGVHNDKVLMLMPDGNTTFLSAEEDPDFLVLVIGINERVMPLPKNGLAVYASNSRLPCPGPEELFETENFSYVMLDEYFNTLNGCTGSGGPGGPTNPGLCDRDINPNKDELYKMKFTSLANYRSVRDGWLNGKIEIKVFITLGTQNGSAVTLTKMYIGKERNFRYCGLFGGCSLRWVEFSAEIVTWTQSEFGNRMSYFLYENDGTGSTEVTTVSFPVTFGSTTYTITNQLTIKSDDYPIGGSSVEYCDNTEGDGEIYRTGVMDIMVRQRAN